MQNEVDVKIGKTGIRTNPSLMDLKSDDAPRDSGHHVIRRVGRVGDACSSQAVGGIPEPRDVGRRLPYLVYISCLRSVSHQPKKSRKSV